jgi:PAP_fibrillin
MPGKADLITLLRDQKLGILATAAQKSHIAIAIAQLEDHNPTSQPVAAAARLEGDWQLLYTTSQELLGLDRIPLMNVGAIYQCIRTADAKIYNIAEIVGIPLLAGIVSVVADFTPISDRRVEVQFTRAIWGAQRLMGYQSVAKFIAALEQGDRFSAIDFKIPSRDRNGWLDITYLDEDLRIGRGNGGSLFVLKKVM